MQLDHQMLHLTTAAALDEAMKSLQEQHKNLLGVFMDQDNPQHIRKIAEQNMTDLEECILLLNERMARAARRAIRPMMLV